MSRGKDPRRKGLPRRPEPSAEAFHEEMRIQAMEDLAATLPGADVESLRTFSRLLGPVRHGERVLPLLAPLEPTMDPMEFDRTVCACGVTHFIRRTLPADQPGEGTTPERFGEFLEIRQMFPGARSKRSVDLKWLRADGDDRPPR